jgi:hypothetical protein
MAWNPLHGSKILSKNCPLGLTLVLMNYCLYALTDFTDGLKVVPPDAYDTVGHPIDTLVNTAKGLYQTVTDPKGTSEQMQAGEGNFKPAGQQVGEQVGTAAVTSAAGAAVGKAIKPKVDATKESTVPTVSSVSKVDLNTRVDDGLQYVQYQNDKGWIWPENLGFIGPKTEKTLPIGAKLDRIGEPTGSFLAPAGTPYESRALAPGSRASNIYEYEVMKPLPVVQGEIAPAFGQPGKGIQILPNVGTKTNVQWLIDNGYIRRRR